MQKYDCPFTLASFLPLAQHLWYIIRIDSHQFDEILVFLSKLRWYSCHASNFEKHRLIWDDILWSNFVTFSPTRRIILSLNKLQLKRLHDLSLSSRYSLFVNFVKLFCHWLHFTRIFVPILPHLHYSNHSIDDKTLQKPTRWP